MPRAGTKLEIGTLATRCGGGAGPLREALARLFSDDLALHEGQRAHRRCEAEPQSRIQFLSTAATGCQLI